MKANVLRAAALLAILTVASCSTVQSDWERAQRENTIGSYRVFIRKRPGSQYEDQARRTIEELVGLSNLRKHGEPYETFQRAGISLPKRWDLGAISLELVGTIEAFPQFREGYVRTQKLSVEEQSASREAFDKALRTGLSKRIMVRDESPWQFLVFLPEKGMFLILGGRSVPMIEAEYYIVNTDEKKLYNWGKAAAYGRDLGEVLADLASKISVSGFPMRGVAPSGERTVASDTVALALKFKPGETTTYRLIMENTNGLEFEGKVALDPTFKGGQTGTRIQMDFTEQIQSVDEKGNALAKITIIALKYLAQEKNVASIDFDSSKDNIHPMAELIGQSYTIEMTPAGKVTKAADVRDARSAVSGATEPHKRASALLGTNVIKQRHSISALPVTDKNQLRTDDNWSNVKTIDFRMMGTNSYEKIYYLKEIEHSGGRRVAVVEMSGIPTTKQADNEETTNPFSNMFENIVNFTGEMRLDLTTGKIEKCVEELRSEWVFVDPASKPKNDEVPDSLVMTAVRVHSLERID